MIPAAGGAGKGVPARQAVLIIDDDAKNLALLSEYLGGYDLAILVAEDGRSGVERARYARPDLVLLDVVLPDGDGYGICRRLKADPETAETPVIFMTALSETEFKVKGFEAGGVDYITKPFRREEVLARVGVHLRLAELSRGLREANEGLERRVEERTAELAEANLDLRRLLGERDALLKEVHHRVKNNLQVIVSLLGLQAGAEDDARALAALERFRARVLSMALVHESLYRSQDFRHVDFGAIASELAAALRSDRDHPGRAAAEISVELGELSMPVDTALPLALALGECVSNSLEHAFPPGWEGPRKVSITGGREGPRCAITIADSGIGLPDGFDPAAGESLGMRIAAAAMSQVGGRLAPGSGPGAALRLEFELPEP